MHACRPPVATEAQARAKRLWPQELAQHLPCGRVASLAESVLEAASSATLDARVGMAPGAWADGTHRCAAPEGMHALQAEPAAPPWAAAAACRALWLQAALLRRHLLPDLLHGSQRFWARVDSLLVRCGGYRGVLC
jgi:hypothetical protein